MNITCIVPIDPGSEHSLVSPKEGYDVVQAMTVDGLVARGERVIGESHAMRPGGFSGKMPRPR